MDDHAIVALPLWWHLLTGIIEIGFRLEWENAVFVFRNGFSDFAVTGPLPALRYLESELFIRSGTQYHTAIAACAGALRYRCDLSISRACFIAAYAEYLRKTEPHH